uniref:Multisubunit sodium/proton antiporter, MrpG subunit n=1 Tax=Candidatus Kentrum eta TaxID=2126337 RepID=A0A450USN6_9GAMM|nr:MAG: multisubunit sodium/proton antiporter, MrpG subunit [Candidatus Kentron sp. H]VFJ95548.1 MAG: multisubunit sodium/proton antiporter, MrpG subunit [Candidatus Kentron sp. H]VFK01780.1 MAG: multisubunit sodium/proton antiporter, MrpG subunit [Candidatus Kentron sp. H]
MSMTLLWDSISWVLLMAGSLFVIIGAIGILRFPDFFTRLHPAGVTDTIGAALILSGLMIQAGPTQVAAKLVLILLFLFFTSPTATHALAKVALRAQGFVRPEPPGRSTSNS